MTLTLIESYSNLNFEVTLFLIENYPIGNPSWQLPLPSFRSYPNRNLDHSFSVDWDSPISSLFDRPRILGPPPFIFLITHLLLRTFHFHSFQATNALLRAVKFHFLNRPSISFWTVHLNPAPSTFDAFDHPVGPSTYTSTRANNEQCEQFDVCEQCEQRTVRTVQIVRTLRTTNSANGSYCPNSANSEHS